MYHLAPLANRCLGFCRKEGCVEYYLPHWSAEHMNAPISSSHLCPGVGLFHGVRTEREAGQ